MKGSVERSSESSTKGLATEESSVDDGGSSAVGSVEYSSEVSSEVSAEGPANGSVEGSSESSAKCLEDSSVIGSVKSSVGNS